MMSLDEQMLERFTLNVERMLDADMLPEADAALIESLLREIRALLASDQAQQAKPRLSELLRVLDAVLNADARILIDASLLESIRRSVFASGDTTD